MYHDREQTSWKLVRDFVRDDARGSNTRGYGRHRYGEWVWYFIPRAQLRRKRRRYTIYNIYVQRILRKHLIPRRYTQFQLPRIDCAFDVRHVINTYLFKTNVIESLPETHYKGVSWQTSGFTIVTLIGSNNSIAYLYRARHQITFVRKDDKTHYDSFTMIPLKWKRLDPFTSVKDS